ncbi:MAG: CHAP domain-containing protein, partial [Dongiaceae bacterium]
MKPATSYQEVAAPGVTCVPYARSHSTIALRGDAYTWWDAALNSYQRGQSPRPGAVLVLGRSDRLQAGHVAVVTQVLGPRQ